MSNGSTPDCGRSLDLAQRLGECCEGYAPVEVIAALAALLASTAAALATHSTQVSKVLGVVTHRAYDGAMTLLAARETRH